MKNKSKNIERIEDLQMKIEEDFHKEAIEEKHGNAMLEEQTELVKIENEALKEEARTLKKSGKLCLLKVEQQ